MKWQPRHVTTKNVKDLSQVCFDRLEKQSQKRIFHQIAKFKKLTLKYP